MGLALVKADPSWLAKHAGAPRVGTTVGPCAFPRALEVSGPITERGRLQSVQRSGNVGGASVAILPLSGADTISLTPLSRLCFWELGAMTIHPPGACKAQGRVPGQGQRGLGYFFIHRALHHPASSLDGIALRPA